MSATDLIHEAIAELDNAWAVVRGKLMEHARDVEAAAVTDATQVVHDAETAAAPVATEAVHDAEQLATAAAADLSATIVTSTPPAPAVNPEVDQAPPAPVSGVLSTPPVADVTTPAPPAA